MQSTGAVAAEGTPAVPARARALRRRRAVDAVARRVVSAGGMATIAGITAIFGFICLEVFPLWKSTSAALSSHFRIGEAERLFVPATEEYREILEVVTERGTAQFLDARDGRVIQELAVPSLSGRTVAAAARAGRDHVLAAATDGSLVALRIPFEVRRQAGERVLRPRVVESGAWALSNADDPPRFLAASVPSESGVTVVSVAASGRPAMLAVSETRDLFDRVQRSEVRRDLPLPASGAATAVEVSANGRRAYVGTAGGFVQYWDLTNKEEPRLVDTVDVTQARGVGVTAMKSLIGDQSLVVGSADGAVGVWFPVRDPARDNGWRLQRVHTFEAHPAGVTAIAASPRDRRFFTADAVGNVWLRHATTARTLLKLPVGAQPVSALAFSPKANGALAVASDGGVTNWDVASPHPEVSLRTLFGKVWYEGYDAPAYVWQSTGGTDDFEPKLSLVPLIFGTMKGTLYGLMFAVPIAVLAALYTSQFTHPRIRAVVKPTVEIMAALPSVVLGFLAGLWLAPLAERIIPAVLAMHVVVPLLMFAAGVAWTKVPGRVRARLHPGTEVVLLIPLIVLGMVLCLSANGAIERLCFGGDFRAWLQQTAGLRYDQRNCLVVGFAMGFAVIPIIFTISEDALSNVPQRLISGSLALGATPWQTALRVVVPTASPGIFSAIMIGFGRAVGETMIVLMATGNTPILEWSPFTGMRTLSASIAVEIPEAPYGGTLYRVLFLAALLLFIATFIVNTAAELVRMRLRRRYQQL